MDFDHNPRRGQYGAYSLSCYHGFDSRDVVSVLSPFGCQDYIINHGTQSL